MENENEICVCEFPNWINTHTHTNGAARQKGTVCRSHTLIWGRCNHLFRASSGCFNFPKDNTVMWQKIGSPHRQHNIKTLLFHSHINCAALSCSVLWSPRFTNFFFHFIYFFHCRYCLLSFWRKAQWLWCDKIIIMDVIFCMFFFLVPFTRSSRSNEFFFASRKIEKKTMEQKKHLLIAIWTLLVCLSILCLVILMSHSERALVLIDE